MDESFPHDADGINDSAQPHENHDARDEAQGAHEGVGPTHGNQPALTGSTEPAISHDASIESHSFPFGRAAPSLFYDEEPRIHAASYQSTAGRGSFWRRIDSFQIAGALVAIGIGWVIGSNTWDTRGDIKHLHAQIDALSVKAQNAQARAAAAPKVAEVRSLGERESGLRTEIAALKTKLETVAHQKQAHGAELQAQMEKIEKDPRLDQLTARLERLEHQLSSPATTASIPSAAQAASPPVPPPTPPVHPVEHHAAAAPVVAKPEPAPPHVALASAPDAPPPPAHHAERVPSSGYVLRDVYRGVALVQDHNGLREVAPGDMLPGAGFVQRIERREDGWVLVTSNGVIDQSNY